MFEINIFGPGIGECIVINFGNGKWAIVDSCIDPSTSQSYAFTYLKERSVSLDDVCLIVATHWHDDHIRGISQLAKECQHATICISAVLSKKEFIETVTVYNKTPNTKLGSGLAELHDILKIGPSRPLKRATADKRILQSSITINNVEKPIEVWSLSPADAEHERFFSQLAKMYPKVMQVKGRATSINPNDTCVVMLIKVGEVNVLLGADLEETGSDRRGWSAIVSSTARPEEKSTLFKIPHHGSENGHNDDVWKRMLEPKPVCLLTPYNRGRVKLPSPSDVGRILEKSDKSYITATTTTKIKRDKTVEKMIRDFGINIQPATGKIGHIKATHCLTPGESWRIELLNGAKNLKDI